MDRNNTTKIGICTDCLMMLANGEGPTEPTDHEPLALVAGDEITLGILAEEHNEGCVRSYDQCECENLGFSMESCEGCGSPLGGDRYAATLWH